MLASIPASVPLIRTPHLASGCLLSMTRGVCAPQGLAQYGNGFLAKLELAQCPSPLLDEITLVDTPGVLSGEKQRIERTYNFLDVCGWFAARCDLILLLFDPHKLDISDEMKQVGGPSWAVCRPATRPRAATPPFKLAGPLVRGQLCSKSRPISFPPKHPL